MKRNKQRLESNPTNISGGKTKEICIKRSQSQAHFELSSSLAKEIKEYWHKEDSELQGNSLYENENRNAKEIDQDDLESEQNFFFENESKSLIDEGEIRQVADSVFLYKYKKLGKQGNVYEGFITSSVYDKRPCAVKFARRTGQNMHESKILCKLANHSHIVSIIQSGAYRNFFDERFYIALEKCHNLNLRQLLIHRKTTKSSFNVNWGLNYIKQIITGMIFIHERLIIHKDLKPSNILLTENLETIKIADFGSSQELVSCNSMIYCPNPYGTAGYRPPEGFGSCFSSLKSDIFSLGVIFIFLLSNGSSPFGPDSHLWDYNIKKGIIKIPQLYVKNRETAEHLLNSMLNMDRRCRPSISQVAEHPCWTGEEVDCQTNYGITHEIDNSKVKSHMDVDSDSSDGEIAGLLELHQFFDANVLSPIVIFDWRSDCLVEFNSNSERFCRKHKFNDEMRRSFFTTVSLSGHIYVLIRRQLHRLKYTVDKAKWERMADMTNDHGYLPPATAMNSAIVIVGGSTDNIQPTSIYIPALNKWDTLKNKPSSSLYSTVFALQNTIYCFGGMLESPTNEVESLDVPTNTWNKVTPMQHARCGAAAAELRGEIYVIGGVNDLQKSVEKYNIKTQQWTFSTPLTVNRSRSKFRCHSISGIMYAVGGDFDETIEKLDCGQWKKVNCEKLDMLIWSSVKVDR